LFMSAAAEMKTAAIPASDAVHGTAPVTVRMLIGGLLLIAAGLKFYALPPESHMPTWLPAAANSSLAVIEAALGLWLLSGRVAHLARLATATAFAAFATYNLTALCVGRRSCACFGAVHVHPMAVFGLDVLVLVALGFRQPNSGYLRRRFAPALALGFFLGTLGAAFVVPRSVFAVITDMDERGAEPRPIRLFESKLVHIDLGTIPSGIAKRHIVQIQNPRESRVSLRGFEATCDCLRISTSGGTIPAQGLATLELNLDLTQRPEFAGLLAIEAKGWSAQDELALRLVIESTVRKGEP
jgi:hypothetical protein